MVNWNLPLVGPSKVRKRFLTFPYKPMILEVIPNFTKERAHTLLNIKLYIRNFFSKCDQIQNP